MSYILGVDLSVYQGSKGLSHAMFDRLTKGGVGFGIFRASLASGYKDPSYGYNHLKGSSRGWIVGAYHFLYRDNAAAQAENFVAAIKAGGGFKDLITVVDVEWASSPSTSPRWVDVVGFIKRFRELVPGQPIGIYTAEGYWRSSYIRNKDASELADFLWQARWIDGDPLRDVTLPSKPPRAGFGGWTTTPLWQWGALHVLDKTFDGNAFYGTEDELRALCTKRVTPIKERPNYRLGYNAAVQAAINQVTSGIQVPAGPPGPAYPAGVADATADVLAALNDLFMGDPA